MYTIKSLHNFPCLDGNKNAAVTKLNTNVAALVVHNNIIRGCILSLECPFAAHLKMCMSCDYVCVM